MKELPTAEEMLLSSVDQSRYGSDVECAMIDFAKLHVKAALKAALEDAPYGSSTDTVSYEDIKDSILNAYPLNNIK